MLNFSRLPTTRSMSVPVHEVERQDGRLVVKVELPDAASVSSIDLMIAADCVRLDGCG